MAIEIPEFHRASSPYVPHIFQLTVRKCPISNPYNSTRPGATVVYGVRSCRVFGAFLLGEASYPPRPPPQKKYIGLSLAIYMSSLVRT